MSPKAKKILIFTGLGIDVAITISLFVIAIIMLVTMPSSRVSMHDAIEENGPFIGYMQQHPTVYFWSCVFPLILLLAGNIVILVLVVRKFAAKKAVAVEDLNEEQKAALRAELLKELQGESNEASDDQKVE